MSRTIDPENLSTQDVLYLKDRPWMVKEFKNQGFDMKKVEEFPQPIPGDPNFVISTQEMSQGFVPDDVQLAPADNGVVGTGAEDDPLADTDYEDWPKADLIAEIDSRNLEEDRENPISKSGTKEELAARLHADDEASASKTS